MEYLGELTALLAAILWSFSSFVFTSATIRLGTLQLNIDRMIMAAILLVITILIFNIDYSMSTTQIIYLTISGFVGLVLGDTFLFKSFKEVGPRIGMLIMSSNPAIAAVLAYFFLEETLSIWSIVGISITLSGIAIVVLEGNVVVKSKFKLTAAGVVFGFLAAAGQGSGLIFAKLAYFSGDIHPLAATFMRIFSAIIILLPGAILLKRYRNPIKIYKTDRKSLKLVAIGSIIGPYLGITLSYLAIIFTKVGIASTLMSTMPIIMLPLTWFFYKEILTWKSIIGAFLAVIGVSILFLF